jgi:hypothetical protein
MKKIALITLACISCWGLVTTQAQIQKGNIMVGASLTDIRFDLGSSKSFSLSINPKAAYFVADNLALGAFGEFGLNTAKFQGITYKYGIGGLGRYYFAPNQVNNLMNKGRFFAEATAGIGGQTGTEIGFDITVGPGYAYFLTPNIALEALLKYHGTFGSGATNGLQLNIGFQIHLPTHKAKAILQEASDEVKRKKRVIITDEE